MKAPAKINLTLVVGPLRPDGKHELTTVYQALELGDDIEVERADTTTVEGFDDSIVRSALALLGGAWRVRIEKHIPVASGLGGGSSDAAAALRLANAQLESPLAAEELHALAARVGADVPFFLRSGPHLGTGDGTTLAPLDLPHDYVVLLLLPAGETKSSTADVYAAFDARNGGAGYDKRAVAVQSALASTDIAALPPNDLASSPLAERLRAEGAFRADVSGAGPMVYGLFETEEEAERAQAGLHDVGETWISRPAWYGCFAMFGSHEIEHGSTRTVRWLRERRFRFTVWIATVEGLLYF
ncbi:MAG: 4-(cytidine 5'-diphospho)-2-C-methyl-D-erythritol kinase, partial [Gaiellaceae bacterium]